MEKTKKQRLARYEKIYLKAKEINDLETMLYYREAIDMLLREEDRAPKN